MSSYRPKHLKKSVDFQNFTDKNHTVTSDPDPVYNCIAFAVGIMDKKYWPGFHPDYYWPKNIPQTESIEAFISLYESFGYLLVTDSSKGGYVSGWEKIAIYVGSSGKPTHAAKQVGPNKWASKLGDWYDIEHTKDAISGVQYGRPHTFMKRKIPT